MSSPLIHPRLDKISRRGFLGLAGISAAGLAAGCLPGLPLRPAAEFPTGGWPTSTPEEQGIHAQPIADMLAEILRTSPYVHSFLLIRNGVLVTEAYFAPITGELPHFLFSATKSVTSALVGIAIQEGYIGGVDQPVLDFFPEMGAKNPNPHLAQLTLEHLLTMSTGHVDYMTPTPYAPPPVDWVEKFLTDKTNTLVDEPGAAFLYTSGAAHTLSAVIQKATGKITADYAAEKLFGPLGIHEFTWLPDQNGISFGNSWLRLKALDMAKLGYLYLNQGAWAGKQVIPKTWIEKSTHKHIETQQAMFNSSEKDGYGYMWWMNGFGGYSAHGYGGQFIFVIPETHLVAVFTGGFNDSLFDTAYQLMKNYVIPATHARGAALARNEHANQDLSARLDQAGHPPKKAVPALPAIASRISGKTFQLPDGVQIVAFFDTSDEYILRVTYPAPAVVLEYRGGLDDIYRLNQSVEPVLGPFTLAVKGAWTDAATFVHLEYPTDNVASNIITCHFTDDRLTLDVTDDFSGASTSHTTLEARLVE